VKQPNRRRCARYHTNLLLRVRASPEHDLDGSCVVISEGGLTGILPKAISIGFAVELRFVLHGLGRVIEVPALIRSLRDIHHGFEFVSLTESDRMALRQFCNGLSIQSDHRHRNS